MALSMALQTTAGWEPGQQCLMINACKPLTWHHNLERSHRPGRARRAAAFGRVLLAGGAQHSQPV